MTATGKGETVALTDPGAPTAMFQALTDFARANRLPAPKRSQYREQQVDKTCPSSSSAAQEPADVQQPEDEAEMDSEAVYAMAPGASQLMLYTDCTQDQGSGCTSRPAMAPAPKSRPPARTSRRLAAPPSASG